MKSVFPNLGFRRAWLAEMNQGRLACTCGKSMTEGQIYILQINSGSGAVHTHGQIHSVVYLSFVRVRHVQEPDFVTQQEH